MVNFVGSAFEELKRIAYNLERLAWIRNIQEQVETFESNVM